MYFNPSFHRLFLARVVFALWSFMGLLYFNLCTWLVLALLLACLNRISDGLLVFFISPVLPHLNLTGDVLQACEWLSHTIEPFSRLIEKAFALTRVFHFFVQERGRVALLLEAHGDHTGPIIAHKRDLVVVKREPLTVSAIFCSFDALNLSIKIFFVVHSAQVANLMENSPQKSEVMIVF